MSDVVVFGPIPKLLRSVPAPTQNQRMLCIEKETKETGNEQAKTRLEFGLRHPSGL